MNSYVVSVNLRSTWVIANSNNGVSNAVEDIKKALLANEQKYITVFLSKSFIQVKFILLSNNEISAEHIKELCFNVLENLGKDDVGVQLEAVGKDELQSFIKGVYEDLSEDIKALLRENFGIRPEKPAITKEFNTTFEKIPAKEVKKEKDINLENFIGFEPLKKWVDETSKMAEKFGDCLMQTGIFEKTAFLVACNKGNGMSTILNTISDVYEKYSLIPLRRDMNRAEKILRYTVPDSRDMLYSPSLATILEDLSRGFNGIVALDISEWMDHLEDRRIDVLLDAAKSLLGKVVFVFTIPYVEQTVFEKVKTRIDDVFLTKTMQFVPPSDEQYFSIFKGILEKNGITVQDDAYSAFVQKIVSERNDGRFYSFNTIIKMANELLYGIIARAAQNDTEIPEFVNAKDVESLYSFEHTDEISGLESLNSMIALKAVKDKVNEILATLKMQKQLQKDGNEELRPCYHMMFTGNPGTGKTVVARIIGRIFKEAGLLEIGNFYEVSRKDFVGEFVGHTAPKTMELCRNARGSVLFVDEAYMLANDNDNYSKEAIGTLIAEMENYRDKMVVIFAGYEKELAELFDLNPGLRDRVPHIINFPNYSRDELKQIFYLQMKNKLSYDDSFKSAADAYFDAMSDEQLNNREFSNGRFVRNLVERIISKSALRFDMSETKGENFVLNASDFNLATATSDVKTLSEKKEKIRKIGF